MFFSPRAPLVNGISTARPIPVPPGLLAWKQRCPRPPRRRANAAPPPWRRAAWVFTEPLAVQQPSDPDPELINDDFAPTPADQRTFRASDFAAFWIALVISIPTYSLAAALIDLGMSWWQGVLTVFVGNVCCLVPMVLNAHAGTKYGLPFPVLARASFGVRGAHLPALARALVACFWFGIQTWIGGTSILAMLKAVAGAWAGEGSAAADALTAGPLPLLGISLPELVCFLMFWAMQVAIIVRGVESIRVVESQSAPVLLALAIALLAWALHAAGGFGPMLSSPSQFAPGMPMEGRFWSVFLPSVTAQVGFWATIALNISDFSRAAVSQRAQLVGQSAGLPLFMAAFSFVGLAVTSATIVMYGAAITDPVLLLGRIQHPAAIVLSLFGLMLATLTTNIAANVVAPANAFVNLAPNRISFEAGALFTAALGALIMPWRLLASSAGFVSFLVGYSVLLGPLVGVMLADYHLVRGRRLDVDALFSSNPSASYWYSGGWNVAALAAVAAGVAPCLPGLLHATGLTCTPPSALFAAVYDGAWFVGAAVASTVYCALMLQRQADEGGGVVAVEP